VLCMVNPRDEYIIKVVGLNLRKLRKGKGLTIFQLAELSNLEKITISRIERFQANPTISSLQQIAQGLGISAYELLKDQNTDT
jgi:transcriptional regulator with XRE-family HTH domain